EKGGATFVDGGIIGPPPRKPGTTRLYLSGEQAGTIARLFEQGPLQAIAIDGGPGAASALKMAYAAYTKGTSALLIAIRALAMQAGVDKALLDEWGLSQPGVAARSESAARDNARKAWRFTGEVAEGARRGVRGGAHRPGRRRGHRLRAPPRRGHSRDLPARDRSRAPARQRDRLWLRL